MKYSASGYPFSTSGNNRSNIGCNSPFFWELHIKVDLRAVDTNLYGRRGSPWHSQAPGKSHREGISLIELTELFPDEEKARAWFEAHVWPDGRHCPRCGSTRTHEASHAKMPYRCTDCRSYFSVENRNGPGRLENPAPQVGLRDLSGSDQPKGCVVHEAASGYQGHSEDRMVHAASSAGSMGE